MRNSAWNEMGRIYTKKTSQKHFHTKITDRKCSLVHSGKNDKNCGPQLWELRTAIMGIADRKSWAENVNFEL
jgi:hypothetical protein